MEYYDWYDPTIRDDGLRARKCSGNDCPCHQEEKTTTGCINPSTSNLESLTLETSPHNEEIEVIESIITQIKYKGRLYKLEVKEKKK